MKKTPTWKYIFILVVVFLGFLYALPNWFGKSPAVQMQFPSAEIAQSSVEKVKSLLNAEKINFKNINQKEQGIDILFAQTDEQIKARDALNKNFPEVNSAVNLLSNTPQFLQSMGITPMNLGLDLRGGVSFLLQVDSKELLERRANELLETSKQTLEKNNIALSGAEADNEGGAFLWFKNADDRSNAENQLYQLFSTLQIYLIVLDMQIFFNEKLYIKIF